MNLYTREIIAKAERGEELYENEMVELYCEAPQVLRERDGFENMLRVIAELPIPGQDNMLAANMRQIALRALGQ